MTKPFGLSTPIIYEATGETWQYKIVEVEGEISAETLSELGSDQWELTAILPRKERVVYYFKRFGRESV